MQKPKVRCFATREEAEAFVNSSSSGGSEGSPVSIDERKRSVRNGVVDSVKVYGRDGSSSDQEHMTPAPKKRKSVGNNLSQKKSVSPIEELQQPNLPEDDIREHKGEGSTSEEPIERKKPKPRVTAKKNSILRIYTDGSALGNGRESAMAGVGVWFGDRDARWATYFIVLMRILTNTQALETFRSLLQDLVRPTRERNLPRYCVPSMLRRCIVRCSFTQIPSMPLIVLLFGISTGSRTTGSPASEGLSRTRI